MNILPQKSTLLTTHCVTQQKEKQNFFTQNKILASNRNNFKKTWEFINTLIGKTHNKRSCIDSLK